jgi:hypothetical protein
MKSNILDAVFYTLVLAMATATVAMVILTL